jgi:putative ABC transport system substrate-binding protein
MTRQFLYRRRQFITLLGGAASSWPLAARAQQPGQMRRIGFLRAAPPPERELNAFLRALADRGYVQGRNFVLVPQWGDGNVARLPELAVALDDRFHETGRHGTDDLFVDSPVWV